MPDEQGYLSFDEVREMLGVTEEHLHNLVRANELRAFRVEGAMKFKRPDVEKLRVEGYPEAAQAEEAASAVVSPDDETMLLESVEDDELLVEEEDAEELDLSLGEEPEDASRAPLILVSEEDGEAGETAAAVHPSTQALPPQEPETVELAEEEPPAAEEERDDTASELDFTDEIGFDILEDIEEEGGQSASVLVEEEPETEEEEIELVPQSEEELWGDKHQAMTMTVVEARSDRVTPILLVVTALIAIYPLLLYIHLARSPMVIEEVRNGQAVARLDMPGYLDVFRQKLGSDEWLGRGSPGGE